MIKGMTGFGSAQISSGNLKAIIEIKSLNHRYCDIMTYLPTGFNSLENKIRQLIQKEIKRGRVSISIKLVQKSIQEVSLNKKAVETHLKYAKRISKEFGIENNLTISDIIKLPGVLETKEILISPEQIWPQLQKSIIKAMKSVIKMRKSEGKSLSFDIKDKLKKMATETKKIRNRAKVVLNRKKKLLSDEEFKSLQKNCDINEELSRLDHFIEEIQKFLNASTTIGKKIDFIAQEMQRETNTIGSKLQDKTVASSVISLKSKIEKIREQAQNIE